MTPTPADSTPLTRRQTWGLRLALVGYLLLALAYGVVNPLFEAPDENWHFFTAQAISETWTLPFVAEGDTYDEFLSQEAAQPPLYYVLSAALIAPLDTAEARDELWLNPYAVIGNASALTNLNNAIHTDVEAWPWEGWVLAAHLLRLFSTLLGFGTLICIWKAGRLIWPTRPRRAVLAVALVAFLPQFVFLHASVTNDTLVIFLASFALWQLVRAWQTGEMDLGRGLLLGITCGLAILSKNAGTLLLIYSVGVLVLLAVRDDINWRQAARWLAALVVPALLIGGWLWLRNWQLYGDPTATEPFIRIAGGDRNYTLWQVWAETPGLWVSLFAIFGWFNVRPPDWVFWFWNSVVAVSAVGAVWQLWRARRRVGRPDSLQSLLSQGWVLPLLLAGWVLAVYAGLLLFMLQTEAAQGRLLFPAILPLALATAFGLGYFRRFSWLAMVTSAVIATYCLFAIIQPAYEPPPIVALVPESAEADIQLGDGTVLAGAEMHSAEITPDQPIDLTLYWRRADEPTDAIAEQVISVFGRDNEEIGKLHSYHGRGLLPAPLWPDAGAVADRFGVRLLDEEATAVPVLARVTAGVAGHPSVQVGEVKIVPALWPEVSGPDLATVGDVAVITDVVVTPEQASEGDEITIHVQWRSLGKTGTDYTVLLHLGQPNEAPLAVGDRPPLNGDYPTRVWEANEVIEDAMTLTLPSGLGLGRYPIWIGLYDTETQMRVPVTVNGVAQPTNVYLAGWIEIQAP